MNRYHFETGPREEQELANAEGNAELFYQADEAMHLEIAQIAGLPLVWDYIEEAKVQMDRVRRLSLSQAQSFDKLIAQHRRIVSAIGENDPTEMFDLPDAVNPWRSVG